MTLPSSGAISWGDIRTEFVQSGAFSIAQCYRTEDTTVSNGSTVTPFGPGTANIPTSGAISASNFYGQSGFPSFQTFVAGVTSIDDGKGTITTYQGWTTGDQGTVGSPAGSSHGTIKTSSNDRCICTGLRWRADFGFAQMAFAVNSDGQFAASSVSSSSSDINLNNANAGVSGSKLNGKVMKVYNGTGTGGTLLGSWTLDINGGQISSNAVMTGFKTGSATSSNQNAVFQANSDDLVTQTLTPGNTYSFTIT